jgi:hypothetical protein
MKFRVLLPLFVVFIFFSVLILLTKLFFANTGVDLLVLMAANCLFFLVSLIAFRIQQRAMVNTNPNAFVRSVMGGVMLKMFVCIAAVMLYVLLSGKNFNKPAVFISMVIYLVYLGVEVAVLMKLNKTKNA